MSRKKTGPVSRQTEYVRRTRAELLEKLGGRCEMEGTTPCRGELQFDHKNGASYVHNKLSSSARLARYKREAGAGELRLLCEKHNLEVRNRDDNGKVIPTIAGPQPKTGHMDFEENPF